MDYSSIFTRTSVQDIGGYAKLLYEEILLTCESSEMEKFKSNKITDLAKSLEGTIKFEYNGAEIKTDSPFVVKSPKWLLNDSIEVNSIENRIYFVSNGENSKFISLLKHLRNAFAHNLVIDDGEYIVLGDFESHDNKLKSPTMLGRVSHENFKLLISTIQSMKNSTH